MRNLIIVLGDQLDMESAAFDDFDKKQDAVWMAEASDESTHVWSTKIRITVFLAAMRHFRNELEKKRFRMLYQELTTDKRKKFTLGRLLEQTLQAESPAAVRVVQPGEWRVQEMLKKVCEDSGVPIEILEDRHFLCTPAQFREHAESRKALRMEYFYREMRKRHNILIHKSGQPVGGEWNFDAANRESFGKDGPEDMPAFQRCRPDKITKNVITLVNDRFADHPGTVTEDDFNWPVTRKQALEALQNFITHRLPNFGQYQDAMWTDAPFLYHSLLSSALNLKLLNPREVIAAAENAHTDSRAPLEAVEGFIRQILGWREYVRGVYWMFMPEYFERNALKANNELPKFYWTGETDMTCVHQALGQTLRHGYAHHIHRLMVTGLFALLYGVRPQAVHEWYLAVYVDAVEWVELPNVLGMSQYGDGGIMASKPYAATGKYIKRMSNYCQGCRYNPDKATGEDACPFTTLYWDFLTRNRDHLETIPRMKMQLRNIDRKSKDELNAIRAQAAELIKMHA